MTAATAAAMFDLTDPPASFLSISDASVSVAALSSGVFERDGGSGLAPGPSGERASPGSSCCPPLLSSTGLPLWRSDCPSKSTWDFWVASKDDERDHGSLTTAKAVNSPREHGFSLPHVLNASPVAKNQRIRKHRDL